MSCRGRFRNEEVVRCTSPCAPILNSYRKTPVSNRVLRGGCQSKKIRLPAQSPVATHPEEGSYLSFLPLFSRNRLLVARAVSSFGRSRRHRGLWSHWTYLRLRDERLTKRNSKFFSPAPQVCRGARHSRVYRHHRSEVYVTHVSTKVKRFI